MNAFQPTFSGIPELLAPAGDRDCIRAAVENGADAVYFGLDSGFNARARAANFGIEELPELMDYLHRRCVKGYVTLNTLAFTNELSRIEDVGRQLAAAGVDAVLVQDLGVAQLLRRICPQLTLHASTQMTLTSAECINAVQELGLARVVLPRELSLEEIRSVRQRTDVPLEAFVHGALCVAYSGQCLTSESLGGRSANRGQCAQACRLAYDLVCDGQDVDLGDQKYLLSPQDLAAFELTTELIEAGICSFKIEGRLKTPEYVANTVQHYRSAIDAVVAGRRAEFSRQQLNDLEMSFSRGFSPGWLQGCDHKMLVPAMSSSKRGVLLGEVTSVYADSVEIQLRSSVMPGDGIVFEGDREQGQEQGGRVYEVFCHGQRQTKAVDTGLAELTFDRQSVNLSTLHPGLRIWKTDDPRLNKRLRMTFDCADAKRRTGVNVWAMAITGQAMRIRAVAENGATCNVVSEMPLEAARKHPLTADVLREQLSRLGGTVYDLNDLDAEIVDQPMVPLSVLGQLRRQMIEQLNGAILKTPFQVAAESVLPQLRNQIQQRWSTDFHQDSAIEADFDVTATTVFTTATSDGLHSLGASARPPHGRTSVLNVLCRSLPQLQHVVQEFADAANDGSHGPDAVVYADFADIREYSKATEFGREHGVCVYPATPRIQKPGEMGIFRVMLKHRPDGVLIRNLAGLDFFVQHGIPVVADFSLNVTNELTAEFLIRHGAARVTASYDMNRDQLLELVGVVPPTWLEIVIHQHMPMFHMEHCVFCAVLSPGTNKTNCGRPCDTHKVELRDRIGMEHPLTADVGCRNTLFNAVPQSSAEVVATLLEQGIRSFRVELLNHDEEEIRDVLSLYRKLLHGTISGGSVWKHLHASNRVGVTRGTLEERRNPLAIL